MAQRTFRGEAGRPFGTVAALICLTLTLALVVLGRIAFQLTGAIGAVDADPARLQAMRDYWGLFLAADIVRINLGGALLLAVWTLARPIGPRTAGSRTALAVGTFAALLMAVAGRQGVVTAAHLSAMEIVPYTMVYAMLGKAAVACTGLWAALIALEARRAQSLPRWMQDVGLAFCLSAMASFVFPPLLPLTVAVSLVWWGGVFATLYKPEDRIAR
jgi:hypothetical protein